MDNDQNYHGPYTGEQIDEAIEKALSPRVDKFNGRTGVVVPQAGDYSAEMIDLSPVSGMTADNVQGAVAELFQSVSEGKALIASAVTDKGVPTAADATFQEIHDNILGIETGGGIPENMYTITLTADPPEGGTVSGGGMASGEMTVTVSAQDADGYLFDGWKENEVSVSSDNAYTFQVTADRSLAAKFELFSLKWITSTLPASGSWYDVAYGSGKFVVVNGYGGIFWSEDGITWTKSTISTGSINWESIAYGGGKFCVVSSTDGKAAWSEDGLTWTEATLPSSGSWVHVAYGGGKFVALKYNSTEAAWSVDGIKWVSSTLPASGSWYDVAYGAGKFIAVLNASAYIWSEDGITWTKSTIPFSGSWHSIAYGNGRFVIVTHVGSKAAWSEDGLTWTESILPYYDAWSDITYGNGKFVVVTDNNSDVSAWSRDGITWTTSNLPSSAKWCSVAYGNKKFVTVATGSSKSAWAAG